MSLVLACKKCEKGIAGIADVVDSNIVTGDIYLTRFTAPVPQCSCGGTVFKLVGVKPMVIQCHWISKGKPCTTHNCKFAHVVSTADSGQRAQPMASRPTTEGSMATVYPPSATNTTTSSYMAAVVANSAVTATTSPTTPSTTTPPPTTTPPKQYQQRVRVKVAAPEPVVTHVDITGPLAASWADDVELQPIIYTAPTDEGDDCKFKQKCHNINHLHTKYGGMTRPGIAKVTCRGGAKCIRQGCPFKHPQARDATNESAEVAMAIEAVEAIEAIVNQPVESDKDTPTTPKEV